MNHAMNLQKKRVEDILQTIMQTLQQTAHDCEYLAKKGQLTAYGKGQRDLIKEIRNTLARATP